MTPTDVHDAEHLAALEARLADLEGDWQNAESDSGSIYTPPPDGEYPAILLESRFIERKTAPHDWYIVLVWKLMAVFPGKRVEAVYSLEDRDRLKILKSVLSRMEAMPEKLTDVRPGTEYMNSIMDMPAIVAVKTAVDRESGAILYDDRGRRRYNVYVNERIGDPAAIDSIDWQALGEQLNGGVVPGQTGFTPAAPASDLGDSQQQLGDFMPVGQHPSAPGDDDIPF